MPEAKRFLLRLDPKLFEAVRRWADDDLRSINAQIEFLLSREVRRAGRGGSGQGHSHGQDDPDERSPTRRQPGEL